MRGAQSVGGANTLPLNLIAQAVPMLTRHELAALADRLIDALDLVDGDCDLEEDDDSGTDIDNAEHCDSEYAPAPDYGIDQRIKANMTPYVARKGYAVTLMPRP